MMGLLRKREQREAGEKVESARTQVDLALLKLNDVLNDAMTQVTEAKEEFVERRSDRQTPS